MIRIIRDMGSIFVFVTVALVTSVVLGAFAVSVTVWVRLVLSVVVALIA